ncbi:hypothetical protein OROMI_027895 [Orobanche minor]
MFAQGKKVIRLFEVDKHMLDYLCTAQHQMHGIVNISILVKWLWGSVPQGSLCKSPEEKCPDVLSKVVLLICVTKVAKSAFDKALAEHEDIDDAVGSEEPTERDYGVDLQQPLLIEIDSSDNHQK